MKPQSFRPQERIKHSREFQAVFDRKKSAGNSMLTLHAAENALDWTRLGVVAPKKRVRRAVDRNRAKRIIREAFRTSKHLLPRGLDLIVVAKRAPLSFSETRKSLVVLAGALAKRLKPPAASGAANAEPIP